MKAKTNLNKQQQLITRAFIDVVLSDAKLFGDSPSQQKRTLGYCFQLLGYQILSNGNAIPLGVEVKTKYGESFGGEVYKDYPDQYVADGKALGKSANPFVPSSRK